MSQQGIDLAAEAICADPVLAMAVLRDGEPALEGGFDLTGDERTKIVEAVRADVEESVGDVQGFLLPAVNMEAGAGVSVKVPAVQLGQLASFGGSFDRRNAVLALSG